MGIFDIFHGEFVDVIDWTQTDSDTMVYRFPRYRNEIKYGAKLTVREGQTAILVNEGKIADVFPAGIYELKTANLPILSTLQNWQSGFESPFKAEVYFFNTTQFLDQKWGTKQAITLADEKFGIVRLRAFGTYTLGIRDPKTLLKKIVGTDGNFEINEINQQLTNSIISYFPTVLSTSGIGLLQLPAHYQQLANLLSEKVQVEFNDYGLQLGRLYIENISLPKAVQKTIDEQTGMNIVGNNINDYAKYQTAKGMANGDGGNVASAGAGMGMGIAMGREMGKEMSQSMTTTDSPPELPVYYLMLSGDRKGPLSLNQVLHYLQTGEADADTLIWRKGMPQWITVGQCGEIDTSSFPPPIK